MASKWREGSKTKKQWMDDGYELREGAVGFGYYYWTYFEPSEVQKMADEDYASYKENKRKQRNSLARERRRREKEERERLENERIEWEKQEDERMQRIKEKTVKMEKDGTIIALVELSEGYYHYEVPVTTQIGDTGIFPFGSEKLAGIIRKFVEADALKDDFWFPDKLRKIEM